MTCRAFGSLTCPFPCVQFSQDLMGLSRRVAVCSPRGCLCQESPLPCTVDEIAHRGISSVNTPLTQLASDFARGCADPSPDCVFVQDRDLSKHCLRGHDAPPSSTGCGRFYLRLHPSGPASP